MATEAQHLEQAEHNRRLMLAVDSAVFPDWVATAAFYAAVHYVAALFARKSHLAGSHVRRNNILKTTYPDVWKWYRSLYDFSRAARYRCYQVTEDDLAYIRKRLDRVESEVRPLLN